MYPNINLSNRKKLPFSCNVHDPFILPKSNKLVLIGLAIEQDYVMLVLWYKDERFVMLIMTYRKRLATYWTQGT